MKRFKIKPYKEVFAEFYNEQHTFQIMAINTTKTLYLEMNKVSVPYITSVSGQVNWFGRTKNLKVFGILLPLLKVKHYLKED